MFGKNSLPKTARVPFQELNTLLPVVRRVHGEAHPELADVERLFTTLRERLEAGASADEAYRLMNQIRGLTKDYTVPADACPAFQKTYAALSKLDDSLRAACTGQ